MNSRIYFVMLLTVVLGVGVSPILLGQQINDRFSGKEECVAAVKSGSFNYYNPSFTSNHRALRTGESIVPLEDRACVDLKIVGRSAWVPQAKGTRYIFLGDQVVAREDCGNGAEGLEYVPVDEPTPPAAATPALASPAQAATEQPASSPAAAPAQAEFTSAPVIAEYVPLSERRVVTAPVAPVPYARPAAPTGWCEEYRPGAKTLWVGGWVAKGYRCHPKTAIAITLAAAGGVVGVAYATNSLWWREKSTPAPSVIWDSNLCKLWAIGGPFYGKTPPEVPIKPAYCF